MFEWYKLPKKLKEYIDNKELMNDFWSYKSNIYISKYIFSAIIIIFINFLLLFLASLIVSTVLIYWTVNKYTTLWRLWIAGIPFFLMILFFLLFYLSFSVLYFKLSQEGYNEEKNDKLSNSSVNIGDIFVIGFLAIGFVNSENPLRLTLEKFNIEISEIDNHKPYVVKGTYNEEQLNKIFKTLFYITILAIVYVSFQFIIGCLCYIFVKY